MIVSFADSSLILSIYEGKISSVAESGFQKNEATLHAGLMDDGSYIQVTPTNIVHVRSHLGSQFKNTKWQCDKGRKIIAACSN